jgi:hypothetical protein
MVFLSRRGHVKHGIEKKEFGKILTGLSTICRKPSVAFDESRGNGRISRRSCTFILGWKKRERPALFARLGITD